MTNKYDDSNFKLYEFSNRKENYINNSSFTSINYANNPPPEVAKGY